MHPFGVGSEALPHSYLHATLELYKQRSSASASHGMASGIACPGSKIASSRRVQACTRAFGEAPPSTTSSCGLRISVCRTCRASKLCAPRLHASKGWADEGSAVRDVNIRHACIFWHAVWSVLQQEYQGMSHSAKPISRTLSSRGQCTTFKRE